MDACRLLHQSLLLAFRRVQRVQARSLPGAAFRAAVATVGALPRPGHQTLCRQTAGGLAELFSSVVTPSVAEATGWHGGRQHGSTGWTAMLLNPFCPFSTARILALRATVLLLLTLLIKAKVRIAAFPALGFALLILQTLIFLAAAGALGVVAAAGGFYAMQQRRTGEA